MKKHTNRYAQISVEGDSIFANFDLELGIVGTKHHSVEASITPAANGWFRCSMTIISTEGQGFVIYLVTPRNAIRAQENTLATSMFIVYPQMELGQVATSYIPTNGTRVTRAADFVIYDVFWSMFRLYGVRDFIGLIGRRGLLGGDGPAGLKGDKGDDGEQGIQGLKGNKGDDGEQGIQGLKRYKDDD